MRRTVRKWFWNWDFDKAEKWLNEMSAKGLHLTAVGWCKYIFEEGNPGEYMIRMEMLANLPSHTESVQYIKFIEDTGAEYLGAVFRFAYFRRKANMGAFDLFSDIDSRIRHLNRILLLLGGLGSANLIQAVNNIYIYGIYRTYRSQSLNLVVGILCGLVSAMLWYGFMRIRVRISKLKKDRNLHE